MSPNQDSNHDSLGDPNPVSPAQAADLQQRAIAVAHHAHAPYSHFRVGAAVLLSSVPEMAKRYLSLSNCRQRRHRIAGPGSDYDRTPLSCTVDEVEGPQGIVRAISNFDIAVDGGHAEKLELGMKRGEHDGDGVISAGVAVEDQFAGHGGAFRLSRIFEADFFIVCIIASMQSMRWWR